MPEAMAAVADARRFAPAAERAPGRRSPWIEQKSPLPQLEVKLLFTAGSAHDPTGKEGLAALTAAMIAEAGSAGPADRRDQQGALSRWPGASTSRWTRR